jgi:cell division protein ZapA
MSNITLTIGGRDYSVACAPGEEAHVAQLGSAIDAKIRSMGTAPGQGETRNLLFAALLLADELHELRGGKAPALSGPDLGPALEGIATRLENCASALEG